jgi:hypothetical protein
MPRLIHEYIHQPLLVTHSLRHWVRFDELNRRIVNGRNAFMAMKFGHAALDKVLKDCFQPAAARAGFALKALNEQPSAGLIDDQSAQRFVQPVS